MKVSFGRKLFAAISIACFLAPLSSLQAATLTLMSDVVSRDKISVGSNHTIKFTTPTGVDSPTDTITLTFPSGFDLSTLTTGDIALSHGAVTGLETGETVAGVAAVGVWGAISSGQVITFTAPTDAAAGEISAGQVVVIRIGTQIGGTHQITNPSAINTYTISMAGTFGDVGGFTVPIVSNDTLSVSATIVAPIVPPPPPGGGGQDVTPPTLSNVSATDVTTSTAKIVWTTDEVASSFLEYGFTQAYASGTASSGAFVLSHSLFVTNLTPDTLYHFRVRSVDGVGNSGTSGDNTFRTASPSHPPVLLNIKALNITDTSAVISWDTDIDASGQVNYGLTNSYGASVSAVGLLKNHTYTLSNLLPQTVYHFQVSSTEAEGKNTISTDQNFTTLTDQTAPANVIGFKAEAGDAQVKLDWQNPPDGDFSKVIIRARTDHSPVNINDGKKVYEGSGTTFVDTPLINGTPYFYTNFAIDANGNVASGALADATPTAPQKIIPKPEEPKQPEPEPKKPEPKPGQAEPEPKPKPEPEKNVGGDVTSTPQVPVETVSGTPPILEEELPSPHVLFSAAAGTVELTPDAKGRLGSGAGQSVLVELSLVDLGSIPQSAKIEVGSSAYALTPTPAGNAWAASFIPEKIGEIPLRVTVTFANGKTRTVNRTLLVQNFGHVWEGVLVGRPLKVLVDADIYAYQEKNQTPIRSYRIGKEGAYGFVVPNGSYRLVVMHKGYQTAEQEIVVEHNWIGTDVSLIPTLKSIQQIFDSKKSVTQNVQAALAEIKPIAQTTLNAVRSPEAQVVAKDVFLPTAVTVAVANTTTAGSAFSLLNYLHYLFTQPFLLFGRRKRKKWGMIYNALSKRPVDLAVVRLIHAEKNLVIQTRITDANGRFSFNARPGKYRVEVVKPGYAFPTQFLKGAKTDVDLVDLYHGDVIDVKEAVILGFNIPVDPAAPEETPKKILFKKTLRHIQAVLGWVSVGLTLVALFIHPTWVMAGVAVGQIGLHFLFRRLAIPKKPKEWGIVADSINGQTLGQSIVRIFDKKFNKLLETQVTDKNGKYGFFVGKNIYYVTAERAGYTKYVSSDVDLTQKEEGVIDQGIRLQKQAAAS